MTRPGHLSQAPRRLKRRRRTRSYLAIALVCGVGLSVYFALYGIGPSERSDALAGVVAVAAAAIGLVSGIHAFRHASRIQRVIAMIALALIVANLAVMILVYLGGHRPPPPPVMEGPEGE